MGNKKLRSLLQLVAGRGSDKSFDFLAFFTIFKNAQHHRILQRITTTPNSCRKYFMGTFAKQEFFEHKFLRQHPIFITTTLKKDVYYIPDFYCHSAKLVIEADGPIHLLKKDYDKNRDEVLSQLGLKILRFENELIINDTDVVMDEIRVALGLSREY